MPSAGANAAHPGLVATAIYHHDGPCRPADLVWAVVNRLLGQDAEHGALPVLYAAVADVPGNSFAGPSHLAHMRGTPGTHRPVRGRARPGSGPPSVGDVSEQLTEVRSALQPVP